MTMTAEEVKAIAQAAAQAVQETYVRKLAKLVTERPGSQAGYLMAGNWAAASLKALTPDTGTNEYPLMLYRGAHDAEETRVVETPDDELIAMGAGWHRNPSPRPPSKYPQHWVEITAPANPSARRVVIHTPGDERTFRQVVNLDDWMPDSKFLFGGVRVGLDTIVAEHATALHRQLDEEVQRLPDADPDIVGYEPQAASDAPAGEGKE